MILGRTRVRRPAASSRSLSRRLRGVLFLLLFVVAAGALWLTLDDRFYIYYADVMGAVRVSPDEIFQASGLSRLHILWVRPAEIEARLLDALPTLKSAQVVCELPAKCAVTVVERKPRMMWDEDGQLWWIDAEGMIFPTSSSFPLIEGDVHPSFPSAGGDAPSFPPNGGDEGGGSESWVVRGPLPRGEDGRLDERVHIALTELWTTGADVSPLLYVPGRGLVFTDERGWRVVAGQGPGMDERLRVLEWLAADLEARGLTPRFVDVRFADAPYYSLTNDW